MSISSNYNSGLDPLALQANYAALGRGPVTPGSDNTWITGSLTSLNGEGNPIAYTSFPNAPTLVSLQNPDNLQQTVSWSSENFTHAPPNDQIGSFITNAERLALVESGGMSLEQAAQVRYYLLHPNETPPSTIKELVDRTLSGVSHYIQENQLSPSILNLESQKTSFEKEVGAAWDAAFEKAIKDKPNADQLRYEHYTRQPGSPMTAEEKAAFAAIQEEHGLPENYMPEADREGFAEQTNINYATKFTSLLKNQSPPLSESDQAKLEYMLYHPDAELSGDLKTKFAALSTEAKAGSGLPHGTDFTFKANAKMYDAKLNGYFNEYQEQELNAFLAKHQTAPWTEDNPRLLREFLAGTTTDVPDFIKAAAATIRQSAIATVEGQFHLQGLAWSPAAPGTFPVMNPVAKAALNEVETLFQIGQGIVAGMPDGPGKETMLNLLMRISHALTELKSAIYESMGGDSAKSRELSRTRLELAEASIKEQMAGAKEVSEKQKKAGDLGNGVNIINAIMGALTILVSLWNPIALAISIMSFIDTVDPNAKSLEKMMGGISDVVGDMLGTLGADAATVKGFQETAKFATVVAIVAFGGGVNAITNGPRLLELAGTVKEISLACGAPEEEADKANKYFAVALGLAATLVTIIVGSIATFGAATGPLVMAGIGKTTAAIMKVVSAVQIALQFIAQMAVAGMSITRSVMLADLALLKGRLQTSKLLNDAEIQELMKLIKKLLTSLTMGSEFLTEITDTQKNLHANAIQSIAGLGTA